MKWSFLTSKYSMMGGGTWMSVFPRVLLPPCGGLKPGRIAQPGGSAGAGAALCGRSCGGTPAREELVGPGSALALALALASASLRGGLSPGRGTLVSARGASGRGIGGAGFKPATGGALAAGAGRGAHVRRHHALQHDVRAMAPGVGRGEACHHASADGLHA